MLKHLSVLTVLLALVISFLQSPTRANAAISSVTIPEAPIAPSTPVLPTQQNEQQITTSQNMSQTIRTTSNGTLVVITNSDLSPTPTSTQAAKVQNLVLPTNIPTPTPRMIKWIFPTRVPRVSLTPTSKPTVKPTASSTPTITPANIPTDDKTAFFINAINDYRRQNKLSDVKTSKETCDFAAIRAKEISTGFNHSGFEKRIQNDTIPFASWSLITENIAMTSNYKDVINMWIKSPGHAANMRKDTPYVCVMQYNNYFAYEGMRP
jgi:uncharacterized protein YkwD